jgi:hypothetical protein
LIGRPACPRPVPSLFVALVLGLFLAIGMSLWVRQRNQSNATVETTPIRQFVKQAGLVENVDAYANDPAGGIVPLRLRTREALLRERVRLGAAGDVRGVARLNGVLSTEAFDRAARVTVRWLDRRDPATGLFPHTLRPRGRYFSYGDVGADLFPFLAITTRYLVTDRYPEILDALASERRISPGFPQDRMFDSLKPREREPREQMLANVEYAKDGLLTLVEVLGPDPWLGRIDEVMDAVLGASNVPTADGPIPSDAAEVNGSVLQVLARLAWSREDPRAIAMARRIADVYLDDTLPVTGNIPPERWDFMNRSSIGEPQLHLGDHGDEIVSGLIEWHRVERRLELPEAIGHRDVIDRMLDRLLTVGRTPSGLWYDGIMIPGGEVYDRTLNDNWGYLGQAYLNQASLHRAAADGNKDTAMRYEQAAREMLHGASGATYHDWEQGDMDGYADTLESALYLLRYLDDPDAARWVDEQVAVLYGFQRDSRVVTDENIDGNFIRTVMLYGRWLTQGSRIEPWAPSVSLGATRDGSCVQIHLHSLTAWDGLLLFDTPRHQQYLRLAVDYPRLNQWQEWWVAEPGQRYSVTLPDSSTVDMSGDQLAAGLPLTLEPARQYPVRVCPRS